VLIPVTASNIPELLLADPTFEHSTRNVVFWHMKISQILWLFQLLQINCSSAVSSLTNGISSVQNTPHWEPFGRIHFHITGSYTINPEAIPRIPMDWATLHVSSCYACLYSTLLCILLRSSRVHSIYTLTVKIFIMAWAGGEGQSGKPSVEPAWP